jgi:hypothetical protein
MKIAIASYNRAKSLKDKTIAVLLKENVPKDWITIFVANEEEYIKYKEIFSDITIVIGQKGLVEIRNFITNYYDENELYVSIDDDINKFIYPIGSTLLLEIEKMKCKLEESTARLLGVNPTGNKFFMRGEFKEGLYFCVGCFFMCKNCKEIEVFTVLDDYERTMESFLRDGKVIRYDAFSFKTKYYATGGASTQRNFEIYKQSVDEIYERYNRFLSLTQKKNKKNLKIFGQESIPHLKFREKKQSTFFSVDFSIDVLPPLSDDYEDQLLEILKETKIPRPFNPARFRKEERMTFGWIRAMFSNKYDWGINNEKHPELYELLKQIGNEIVPHKWESIQVSHNMVCKKHFDSKNSGKSTIFSIGRYSGCKLMINGIEYDAYKQPLSFNGGYLLHWNTNDLIGEKYSIVYY